MILYLWMIVQIISESLPISSSGHTLLLQQLLYKYQYIVYGMTSYNLCAFDYVLQGLSSIVVFFYFFPYWWSLIIDKPIKISSLFDWQVWKKNIFRVFLFGCAADSITFLFWYFQIAEKIELPLFLGFMITGIILWSLRFVQEKSEIDIWSCTYGLIVGTVQGFAMIPGISRFGTTFATLQWLGYKGRIAFAISFLLQWPLSFAAALKGFYVLQDVGAIEVMKEWQFIFLVLLASCASYYILKYVGKIIDKKLLWIFSYYMIIPCVIAFLIKEL